MKSKTFTCITKVLLLAVLFLFVGVRGWGQTILNFPLTSNNSPSEYTIGNDGCQILETADGNVSYSTTNGAYTNGWDNGSGTKYWYTTAFNTTDLKTIAVGFQLRSAGTGPRDLALEYSFDNNIWVNVTNIEITGTTLVSYGNFALPETCSNRSTLYIRIIMTSNISVDATTVNSSTNFYLKGLVISGVPPSRPTSQASNISFIAITPTTIKMGCTKGNGDHRIIVMNTTNSFTLPGDNYVSNPNSIYTSGEQVIFDGTGTTLVVTVPSSANNYYFRVFDYNLNDGMTRYITSTASGNPKQCLLETIINPAHQNIRLTTALLGGQITTDQSGTINERGIFWKTSPGVSESDNNEFEESNSGGIFTINVSSLTRSSTIYYKAYVINASGMSLTEELSFDNIPEFANTGTWDDNTKWDVLQVPGSGFTYGNALDKPIINGTCTLNSNTTVTNLTINSSKQLNISPDFGLTVSGTLTNNGGTAGLKLLSTSSGTGSLIHNMANVNATVQRYISGTSNDLTAKAYHLVSVPINSATYLSGVWLDSYLFTYLQGSNTWFNWDDPTGNILNTKEGAMVYYSFGNSKTYSITGQLNNGAYSPTVAYSGAGTGYNLVPNPYPSAINWNAASGWTKTNISGTIYGFNPTSKAYGAWNGSTGTESVTNIIPVGQAFFVVASGAPTLTMNNNVRLHDTKDFLKSSEAVPDVLHLIAAGNEAQNEIAIQFADDATINGNDNLDAIKFYSDMTVPQFSSFTSSDPSLLTINAIPYSEESAIVPLRFDMDFTGEITFTASGMESFENNSSIKLEDKQLAQLIDLRKNPVYTFNHTPTDSPERFTLHFGGVLGLENPVTENLSTITVSGSTIYLNYPASNASIYATLFDVQGRLLKRTQLSNAGQDNFSISTDGIYILKLSLPSGTETHKIVVR